MSKIIVSTQLGKVENIQEILPGEFAKVQELQSEGVLKHLYVKEGNTGAVLVFEGITLERAKSIVAAFPLYPHFNQIDYTVVEQNF